MPNILNLNETSPAAPGGAVNIDWQIGASTSVDPSTGQPIVPVTASIPILVGDHGAGGSAGLAPAPAAGDAAAGKYLKADGTYEVPTGTSTTLPTGSGNKILATPANGSSGMSALRAMVAADMPIMVGDSGSGGTSGAAPAPAAGDAAAGKYLKADGTFAVPAGSGMTNPMSAQGDLIVGAASGTPARLAAGTAGYVLQTNGNNAAPSWVAASSGSSIPTAVSLGPDWPPALPSAYDDEFTGSSLNTSLWTQVVNGAPNTIQVGSSHLGIVCPAHSGDNFTTIMQAAPSTPYTVCAKIHVTGFSYPYFSGGLCLGDSNGKIVDFTFGIDVNSLCLTSQNWNSHTSYSSRSLTWYLGGAPMGYLKVTDNGTNLIFYVSMDGVNFVQFYSESRTAFLSSPTLIGILCGSNDSAGHPVALGCDWFRKVA